MKSLIFLLFINCFLLPCLATTPVNETAEIPGESSTSNPINYEARATETLNIAVDRNQKIRNRQRELFFSMTKGRGYNVINQGPIKQEIENDYHRLLYDMASNFSRIPVDQIKNETLQRIVKLQSKLQLYGLKKSDFDKAKEILHRMQTFYTQRLVCHVHHPDDCTLTVAMVPTITMHSMRIKRIEELNYYWHKWRQAINDRNMAKSNFINYVRLLRISAAYNGHVTPSRTWYLQYETENFQRELEDVVWELMPLYRELHAYLRHSVRQVYGNHVTETDGAIPASLMEQFIQQAWFGRTTFRVPYPDSHLPTVKTRLEETLVTPLEIVKKAAEYFRSLDMPTLPRTFYEEFVRRISDGESGADCRSEVHYIPPDVALRYCPNMDYKKLMQMHGQMNEIFFNLYRKQLPMFLDREPCPGFITAIGEAAVIASGTPKHLHKLRLLANDTLSKEQAMNRVFRMGIHTILAIPQYFVIDKFLVDVMDGRIGSHEYNCGYWQLQYKYAGVVPPTKRNERHFDPDYKFYRGLNPEKSNTVKFLSEVLGHQFYRTLCLESGQYRPGDPDYPLHNCDFYGNVKAGTLIKNVMELGATKHWRDILEMATGDRKLSAKGVLEYFAPLLTWLKQKNKELHLEVGWDADIRCHND